MHFCTMWCQFKMQIQEHLSCVHNHITQLIFHSLYMGMNFILNITVKILHQTNSTAFISLLDMSAFYQHSVCLAYWWVWSQRETKYGSLNFPFSFYVIVFSVSGCLIQGSNTSETGYDRALRSLLFLRMSYILSVFQASSRLNGKWGFSGLSAPHLSHRWNTITLLNR